MRRLTLAVAAAALMALSLAPAASATSATSTPFAGVWVSTDLVDGSAQLLTVSGGSAPTVTFQDFHASICGDDGSNHWVATGSGTLTEYGGLHVVYNHVGCGSYRWPAGTEGFFFFDGGTLFDQSNTPWSRLH